MSYEDRDIIELLKEKLSHHQSRRDYHIDQVRRLHTALDALTTEGEDYDPNEANQPDSYSWASNIDDLFNKHEKLSVEEVRELLIQRGLPAGVPRYSRTVQGTIARKYRNGELERVELGVYRRPQSKKVLQANIDFKKVLINSRAGKGTISLEGGSYVETSPEGEDTK